ncbi:hypothetical protein IAS59_003964 [Cryptococcus gattii]
MAFAPNISFGQLSLYHVINCINSLVGLILPILICAIGLSEVSISSVLRYGTSATPGLSAPFQAHLGVRLESSPYDTTYIQSKYHRTFHDWRKNGHDKDVPSNAGVRRPDGMLLAYPCHRFASIEEMPQLTVVEEGKVDGCRQLLRIVALSFVKGLHLDPCEAPYIITPLTIELKPEERDVRLCLLQGLAHMVGAHDTCGSVLGYFGHGRRHLKAFEDAYNFALAGLRMVLDLPLGERLCRLKAPSGESWERLMDELQMKAKYPKTREDVEYMFDILRPDVAKKNGQMRRHKEAAMLDKMALSRLMEQQRKQQTLSNHEKGTNLT